MKVGIVTLLGNNYGGALQAYALKRIIQELGFETEILNYIPKEFGGGYKEVIKKVVYAKRNIKFNNFRKKNFNLTSKIKDLSKYVPTDDIYVAGSDQIWNSNIAFETRKYYYLNFVKDKEKVAYAASVGKNYFTESEKEKKEIGKMLNSFRAISIREKEGVDLYNQIVEKNIENVLDPTLLLSKEEWREIETKNKYKNKYMLVYTLGANKKIKDTIRNFSEKYNKKILDINYKKEYGKKSKIANGFGPIEFITAIDCAECVITNSFHGMVFSIIFEKPFFVVTRGNMNSRMENLLKKLQLTDRIIKEEEIEKLLEKNIEEQIDYKSVKDLLEQERQKSFNFLKNALNIEETNGEIKN